MPSHLEFARQVRVGSTRVAENVAMNFLHLPEFAGTDMLDAIDRFLTAELPEYKGQLLPIAGSALAGNSDDPVVFLKSPEGKLLLVVKAFKHVELVKCDFLPELSAMDFLSRHPEFEIAFSRPLAVGKTQIDGVWYGLLAQSPAPGVRLDALFTDAWKSLQGEERESKIAELEGLFFTVGATFARFNVPGKKAPIDPKFTQRLRKKMAFLADEFPEEIERIEQKIAEAEKLTFTQGFAHFSPHYANVFYIAEEGKIALIDLAKMHKSLDIEERPLSFSAYDLARFLYSFEKNAHDRLLQRKSSTSNRSLYSPISAIAAMKRLPSS